MIESRHLHTPKTMYSLIQGFHNSLEALARSGNYMVIDHVFQEMEWLSRCLTALKDHKVYFIGIHCDLEILKQRELDRGNRGIGIAEYQYNKVHANVIYDLSLDTGTNSPESNAKNILEYINETESPQAWQTLLAKNVIA